MVVTDYPDASLVDNISFNVSENTTEEESSRVNVQGYIWGHPVKPLLDALPSTADPKLFDMIILSDLIFNHSQVRTRTRVFFHYNFSDRFFSMMRCLKHAN